ncbi:MAG: hypothetical protein ACI8QT_000934 [Halioglobus sp.]|jgi:hypothetical protein
MSLESWDPETHTGVLQFELQETLLARLIGYSAAEQLEELDKLIIGDERQALAQLMKVDHRSWQAASEPLADDELLHLIRFFAMAENLPGWEAQETSPVIPLAKALRKRGVRLEKPLLQWLRQVNNNRFLPYGPL